jgi:NAD(P)-dependent dehydrogenase (short-subunit alcohol dehydrogenase family)
MAKTWLVTGSSRGLGRKIAEAVLAAGHNLVATARKPEQLADLVERYGDRVRAVALDVTDERAAEHAVTVAEATFGGLDVVVNNAGYGDIGSIEDMSPKMFRDQIETNFFGVVNVTRAALPVFRKQKSGQFLQVSSIGGRLGGAGLSAYQSAKWAMEGFSEVLSKEVAPFGVKVTIDSRGERSVPRHGRRSRAARARARRQAAGRSGESGAGFLDARGNGTSAAPTFARERRGVSREDGFGRARSRGRKVQSAQPVDGLSGNAGCCSRARKAREMSRGS